MNTTTEEVATSLATKSMGGGSVTSVIGWASSNEAMALIGIVITILGFVVNFIFQLRRDARERELQRAQITALDEHGV